MSTIPLTNPDPKLKAAEDRLREVMLAFPEATEEFPWGHRSAKVKGKMFAILVLEDQGLTVTTKLPESNEAALTLPFTAPTGYGMGKSGWVTSTFKVGDAVPVELLSQWIHESFRAVAPQKVLKAMGGAATAPAKNGVAKPGAARTPAAKSEGVQAGAEKKAPARNVVSKPAAAKKALSKPAPVKKAPAKNVMAKSAAVKKTPAKKNVVAKSAATKKAAAKRAPAAATRRGTAAASRSKR